MESAPAAEGQTYGFDAPIRPRRDGLGGDTIEHADCSIRQRKAIQARKMVPDWGRPAAGCFRCAGSKKTGREIPSSAQCERY